MRLQSSSTPLDDGRRCYHDHVAAFLSQRLKYKNQLHVAYVLVVACCIGLALTLVMHQSLSSTAQRTALGDQQFLFAASLSNETLVSSPRRRALELGESIVWGRLRKNLERRRESCHGSNSSLRGMPSSASALYSRLSRHATEYFAFRCPYPTISSNEHIYEYAIIATLSFEDPRTVFVNCLKWLLDGNAKEIWLLVPTEFQERLIQNVEYGSRLLQWNKTTDHPVRLIFADSLWQAIARVHADSSKSIANAIAWRNADLAWRGNRAVMDATLSSWQKNLSILYATHGLLVDWSTRCGLLHHPDGHRISFALLNQSSLPHRFLILDSNGLLFHRDYLCYASHPILDQVRQLANLSWSASEFALSMLLMDMHLDYELTAPRLTSEERK